MSNAVVSATPEDDLAPLCARAFAGAVVPADHLALFGDIPPAGTHFARYWPFVRGIHRFTAQRQVTRNFDVFFDLRPNKRLSKQWWGWWVETPSTHYDVIVMNDGQFCVHYLCPAMVTIMVTQCIDIHMKVSNKAQCEPRYHSRCKLHWVCSASCVFHECCWRYQYIYADKKPVPVDKWP